MQVLIILNHSIRLSRRLPKIKIYKYPGRAGNSRAKLFLDVKGHSWHILCGNSPARYCVLRALSWHSLNRACFWKCCGNLALCWHCFLGHSVGTDSAVNEGTYQYVHNLNHRWILYTKQYWVSLKIIIKIGKYGFEKPPPLGLMYIN